MIAPAAPVIIVGAGPTGLTAAALLGEYGIECLVLDRWESVYPQPRAVHLDDEVYRIFARLGLHEQIAAISRPCHGLRLVERDMHVLAEVQRDAGVGPNGFPLANMFDQPDLERVLRENLRRYDSVTLRGGVEVVALRQDGSGPVRVEVTDRTTGERDMLLAEYVLGCDGANSIARPAIGSTMQDLKFEQRWLVVDITTDADLGEWEGVHQVCDTDRAATYMRIGETRYRWEFRLAPGETADDHRDMGRLHPLISPWTKGIPVEEIEIVRVAEYTFRAQIADRWRYRRIFLLGDAAHLTPPFIGQGMGAGVRDAAKLAWKLASTLRGDLPELVLATYEIERKPHARAMIGMAKLIGTVMTGGGRLGSVARRLVVPHLHRVPGLGQWIVGNDSPPLRRSGLVVRPRIRASHAGRLCPNALLDDGRRLDEMVAGRFLVVTAVRPSAAQQNEIERRGAELLVSRPGSELDRWLRERRAHAVVVRPDGTVLRALRDLALLGEALPTFRARHGLSATATGPALLEEGR